MAKLSPAIEVSRNQGRLVIGLGTLGQRLEDIAEALTDDGHGCGVGIDVEGRLHGPIDGPEVVDAVHVVGVVMGEQHRVEAAHVGIQ